MDYQSTWTKTTSGISSQSYIQSICFYVFEYEIIFRYGKVEDVKLLPLKHAGKGLAAFIDFYDIEAAKAAYEAEIKIKVFEGDAPHDDYCCVFSLPGNGGSH